MATKAAKKRLDAAVERMGATEAAVVLAKLALDADKKGKPNPAIADIWRVFEKRLEESRGTAKEPEAVKEYNRLIFLDGILSAANGVEIVAFLQASAFDSFVILSNVYALLREDATTLVVRSSRRQMLDSTPKPVEREAYDRLLHWAESDILTTVDDVIDLLTWDKGLEEDALDELAARLKETLHTSGDLVEGWSHSELWAPVAIVEGTIPAWAALRAYWKSYVYRRDYKIKEEGSFWQSWPAPIDQVVDRLGLVIEDADAVALAADFYRECRRRRWGQTLNVAPDLDQLVGLLYQSANPFLHLDRNFDAFGRVNWATFAKDGDPAKMVDTDFETAPAATAAAMGRAAAAMGFEGVDLGDEKWIGDFFYPASSPGYQRGELARLLRQMEALETTRQPFSHDLYREPGEMPLNEFMGFHFETPLEKKARELETYDGIFLGIKEGLRVVSDTYFAGRPILFADNQEILDHIEDYLLKSRQMLESWCDDLERWPWSLNVSTLRPEKVSEPDEDTVALIAGRIVTVAAKKTKIKPAEVELPTTPYYGKGAKK